MLKGNLGKEFYLSINIYGNMQSSCAKCAVRSYMSDSKSGAPPGLNVSELVGFVKERTAIGLFATFPYLRKHKLWGQLLLASWV